MSDKMISSAGIVAAAVFWSALFVFAALRPDYTHFHKAISELGAFGAPQALAWNLLGFIVPGVLLAVCGSGIAMRVDGRRTSLYWFLVISGLGFSGTGVFPTVMQDGSPSLDSAWTIGHVLMTFLSGFPWLIASVILALHVRRSPHWQSLTTTCWVLSLFAIASLLVNILSRGLPYLSQNPGLAQRIAFACYFAWFLVAGFLFSDRSSTEANGST